MSFLKSVGFGKMLKRTIGIIGHYIPSRLNYLEYFKIEDNLSINGTIRL